MTTFPLYIPVDPEDVAPIFNYANYAIGLVVALASLRYAMAGRKGLTTTYTLLFAVPFLCSFFDPSIQPSAGVPFICAIAGMHILLHKFRRTAEPNYGANVESDFDDISL